MLPERSIQRSEPLQNQIIYISIEKTTQFLNSLNQLQIEFDL